MGVLTADGLVRRTSGVGTLVAATAPTRRVESWKTGRELLAHTRNSRQKILSLEEVDAIDGIKPSAVRGWSANRWMRVAILRFEKESSEPYALSELYIDMRFAGVVRKRLVVGSEGIFRKPVFDLIAKTYRVIARKIDQSITAVPAPRRVARLLNIKTGLPLLRVVRYYFDEHGGPIETTVSHFLGETFTYTSTLHIGSDEG